MYGRRCAILFDELFAADSLPSCVQPTRSTRVSSSIWCCPPSLRSLSTMRSNSNSLAFREAGSLISFAVTALQDYDPLLASPHRHHRSIWSRNMIHKRIPSLRAVADRAARSKASKSMESGFLLVASAATPHPADRTLLAWLRFANLRRLAYLMIAP